MKVGPRVRRRAGLATVSLLVLLSWRSWAQAPRLPDFPKPKPDLANVRYGPHERNVLDLWKARPGPGKTGPAPVVVFFHGGAFLAGDKSNVPGWLVARCRAAGISVASANYRYSSTAAFPAPMLDGARAIQYLRSHAQELGIDPNRIAGSGSSAGAGIALWVGFHDDLADPRSTDPIARPSTRLTCLGVNGAQSSYDPRFIKQVVGGRATSTRRSSHSSAWPIRSSIRPGPTSSTRKPRRSITPRPATRRSSSSTPSPTNLSPPMPSRGRGSITLASARHSRPSSTRSASNALSATPRISPGAKIPASGNIAR